MSVERAALSHWPLDVYNDGGSAAPPHAIMRCEDAVLDDDSKFSVMKVTEPNADGLRQGLLINSSKELATSGEEQAGTARSIWDGPFWVAYDPDDGDPDPGDEWGPEDGSWLITSSGNGIYIIHTDTDNQLALASALGAGTSVNKLQLEMFGFPQNGTIDLDFELVTAGISVHLEIDWNQTAADVEAQLLAITGLDADNTSVIGGDFPNVTITISFFGDISPDDKPANFVVANNRLGGGVRSNLIVRHWT